MDHPSLDPSEGSSADIVEDRNWRLYKSTFLTLWRVRINQHIKSLNPQTIILFTSIDSTQK